MVEVEQLRVDLLDGTVIVQDVNFSVPAGHALGLVGETGCGKTTTAMALLGYARPGSRISAGRVLLDGTDILRLDRRALQALRGRRVSLVSQNPSAALNPGMRIGPQIEEILTAHGSRRAETRQRTKEMLSLVHLDSSEDFLRRYPHQLSGGQQQRVAIAMALIWQPDLIVLDEPTTGLDVTTQARILELVGELRARRDTAFLYVTHDLGVVSRITDHVAVMYGGRVVEAGPTHSVFASPHHPYTQKLIAAMPRSDVSAYRPRGIPGTAVAPEERLAGCPFAPRCDFRTDVCNTRFPPIEDVSSHHIVCCFNWQDAGQEICGRVERADIAVAGRQAVSRLEVSGLVARYARGRAGGRGEAPPALHDVSFVLREGECLAVVGESGSGKTTLARCIVGIHAPESGRVLLDGKDLPRRAKDRSRAQRRRAQIVFQNPDESLNPRQTVAQIVARPIRQFFRLSRKAARVRALETLELVRLDPRLGQRFPLDLSGGEKQRVAIARALAAQPDLLICDEVTSALDVSVQAAILELIADLRVQLNMSLLFISHDLAVVRSVADRILVLEKGEIRELAQTDDIFERPQAEYTRSLMESQRRWSLSLAELGQ